MKKMKLFFNLMMGILFYLPALAYDFEVDGIFYDIISLEDLTCKVTYDSKNSTIKSLYFYYGLNGQYNYWSITTYPSYSGDIVIPAKVNYKGRELSVTEIGERAFLNCTTLTSLTLPSSITNIEQYTISDNNYCYAGAFDYCGIESLTVGNAYTLTRFNQTYAYYNNNKTKGNLKNLYLSDDFSGIIDVNFSNYAKLVSIQSNSIIVPEFSSGTHFTNEQYLNLSVFVPEEAFSAYQVADVWKDFWELTAMKSVKTILLNETSLSLEPKQTFQLTPTILPEDTFDPSVIWSSSNPSVATVNSDGLVTAETKGDAVITVSATDGSGVYANCDVHVDLLVKEIALSEKEIGLEPGASQKLEVALSPREAFVKEVIWSSEDENIASVDQNGNVTANNIGITNINVSTTDGSDLTASCKVTVAELVKSVEVSPLEATINESETIQLTCVVLPETATYKDVVWSSEDEDIATVNSEGIVTAVSSGSVKIKAMASDGSNVYGESTITVDAVTIETDGICYQRNSPSTLKIISNSGSPYSGDFIVSSSAIFDGQEMPVTEIGIGAFSNCDNLTSIVIPNTITKIREPSFDGCSNLEFVKICNGSIVDNNIDILFPDSPIKELYVGSDAITYNDDSRILGIIKGLTLGNSVSTFPQSKVFKNLKYFIMEDGDLPIVEPEDYCTSSMSLINTQTLKDPNIYIYYRFFYLVTYTHLSPILTALQNNILDYVYIGRDVHGVEVDTSKTQEKIPTTAGDRYQEFGYYDEVNYQYQEVIAKTDYNRYPVENISFESEFIELKVGNLVKLNPVYSPSSVVYAELEWTSSDEKVVTVDIFGNVKKISEGEATITVSTLTPEGVKLSASCKIVDEESGVDNIKMDSDELIKVYNLEGILIKENIKIEELRQLHKGIYIIVSTSKSFKIKI